MSPLNAMFNIRFSGLTFNRHEYSVISVYGKPGHAGMMGKLSIVMGNQIIFPPCTIDVIISEAGY